MTKAARASSLGQREGENGAAAIGQEAPASARGSEGRALPPSDETPATKNGPERDKTTPQSDELMASNSDDSLPSGLYLVVTLTL